MPKTLLHLALLAALSVLPIHAQAESPPAPTPVSESAILAPLAPQGLLTAIDRAGDRLVAVGERGHILISDDHGQSWNQVPAPTRALLTHIAFTDAQHGWALGHDATILGTNDGGKSWQLQFQDAAAEKPLLGLYAKDSRTAIAVGAYGLYETTLDGTTWAGRIINDDATHFNAIQRLRDNSLLIAGEQGGLYRSRDDGLNWQKLESPYTGSFFGFVQTADGTIYLYGLQGNLYKSTDFATSWQKITTNSDVPLLGGTVLKDGRILIVGLSGTILLSTDNGQSFATQSRRDRIGLTDVIETTDGSLIFLSEQGPLTVAAGKQDLATLVAAKTLKEQGKTP